MGRPAPALSVCGWGMLASCRQLKEATGEQPFTPTHKERCKAGKRASAKEGSPLWQAQRSPLHTKLCFPVLSRNQLGSCPDKVASPPLRCRQRLAAVGRAAPLPARAPLQSHSPAGTSLFSPQQVAHRTGAHHNSLPPLKASRMGLVLGFRMALDLCFPHLPEPARTQTESPAALAASAQNASLAGRDAPPQVCGCAMRAR